MAKVKTVTKKLKKDEVFVPQEGFNYNIYAYKTGSNITDGTGNDKLYGGNGNDTLVAGKGDDVLSGGKGENTLTISGAESGSDTIVLGKGTDHLTFDTSTNFSYKKSGNNLIITHNNGEVTVKNYFKYADGKASLKDLNGTDLNTLINAEGLTLTNVTSKNKKIVGTYLSDVIVAEGETKNTIYTGKGNDSVDAGNGNDTIIIDGEGTKTIKVSKDKGSDTIIFKGNGVKAEVILDCDFDIDPNTGDYCFQKIGNNLCLTKQGETSDIVFLTIKDYFKYNSLNISAKDADETEYLTTILKDNMITVIGNAFKASTLVGTEYDDFISGGLKVDKITTGDGDDEVRASLGNDIITINGKGNKDIAIGRGDGNDTIKFDLDDVTVTDKIKVDLILDDNESITYSTKNQDLIITKQYAASGSSKAVKQAITVKNYFGNTNKVELLVNHNDVYSQLVELIDVDVVGTKGTILDDEITGTTGNDTIYGYSGNDIITATKGDDKIYGGDGDDRYVYNGFTDSNVDLGHDTIYNSNGSDTISIGGLDEYAMQNYFEPAIINETNRVYPAYTNNQFYDSARWTKRGNDLILGTGFLYDDGKYDVDGINTITLKDYFKAGKDGFGVKYMDNGESEYVTNEWVGDIVKNENYQSINILDDARLVFDGDVTPNYIKWNYKNNFTGTFMNDIIRGCSKPETLRGGDGNDIIYGNFANGKVKDKLYGDEGNDIIFGSNSYMYGGSGNDIFVPTSNDGANIISDESGYDRISLMQGNYLTYFDVSLNGDSYNIGNDIYIKNITQDAYFAPENVSITPIRENGKGKVQVWNDETGEPAKGTWNEDVYDYSNPDADNLIYRYAGRPVFEVSDAYYAQLVGEDGNITLLENVHDYGENKRYMDGYDLAHYEARDGYKLVYANWDMWVVDKDYTYYGFTTEAIPGYEDSKVNIYDTNRASDGNPIGVGGTATEYQGKTYYSKALYGLTATEADLSGIRSILKDDTGVIIKNGTKEETAIETIMFDRECNDEIDICGKEDTLKIGDYNQKNITDTAAAVAEWLRSTNKYTSVQDAINRGTKAELDPMFALFENVYEWTTDVKYRKAGYIEEEKIVGTAILEDNDIITPLDSWDNTTYEMTLKNEDQSKARMSMISDYMGDDELILDYNENGYSFLFDVEIDKNGKLQNYSRDFFVKFNGEEAENTGVQIMYGRETRHAIETVVMKDSDGNYKTEGYIDPAKIIFTYNQDTVDSVRQQVAGWLYDNGYASVQDVLHTPENGEDINAMMAIFDTLKPAQA